MVASASRQAKTKVPRCHAPGRSGPGNRWAAPLQRGDNLNAAIRRGDPLPVEGWLGRVSLDGDAYVPVHGSILPRNLSGVDHVNAPGRTGPVGSEPRQSPSSLTRTAASAGRRADDAVLVRGCRVNVTVILPRPKPLAVHHMRTSGRRHPGIPRSGGPHLRRERTFRGPLPGWCGDAARMTGTAPHASSSVTEDAAESKHDCDLRAEHATPGGKWITGGVRKGSSTMQVGPVDVLVVGFPGNQFTGSNPARPQRSGASRHRSATRPDVRPQGRGRCRRIDRARRDLRPVRVGVGRRQRGRRRACLRRKTSTRSPPSWATR